MKQCSESFISTMEYSDIRHHCFLLLLSLFHCWPSTLMHMYSKTIFGVIIDCISVSGCITWIYLLFAQETQLKNHLDSFIPICMESVVSPDNNVSKAYANSIFLHLRGYQSGVNHYRICSGYLLPIWSLFYSPQQSGR